MQTSPDKKLIFSFIAAFFFVSIAGTLFHFLYEWTGYNRLIGYFVPVNESVWEHIKLLFFPMLLACDLLYQLNKSSYPCILPALIYGLLLGCLSIPALYYSYSGILGFHIAAVDIGIFYVSVFLALFFAYRLSLRCIRGCRASILLFLTAGLFLMFLLFTYHPPELGIFEVPDP